MLADGDLLWVLRNNGADDVGKNEKAIELGKTRLLLSYSAINNSSFNLLGVLYCVYVYFRSPSLIFSVDAIGRVTSYEFAWN